MSGGFKKHDKNMQLNDLFKINDIINNKSKQIG